MSRAARALNAGWSEDGWPHMRDEQTGTCHNCGAQAGEAHYKLRPREDDRPDRDLTAEIKVSAQADVDADDAATLRDAAEVLRRQLPDAVDALAVLDLTADMLDAMPAEVDPARAALEAAAAALEAQPPMLRGQYVATLRLYAAEPWRIEQ